MYLIISDSFAINFEERYYIKVAGKYYDECMNANPMISSVSSDDLEEILIYSSKKEDATKMVKCTSCKNIEIDDGSIRIEYGVRENTDTLSETVRKRAYGYCKRNNLLNESGFVPSILLIPDISDYTYVKVGKVESKFQSLMSKCEELRKKNDWLGIVKLFPEKNDIQNHEYWNDTVCLNDLSFALSKLDMKFNTPKSSNRTDKYSKFFLKVVERILELNPKDVMALSTKGYYYYNGYTNEKKDYMYTSALKVYEELIPISTEVYKEKYRLAQLRKLHFETNSWNGTYTGIWHQTIKEICDMFEELITSYDALDENRKKKYYTYYLRSLFGYATFCIDNTLNYWDSYVDLKIQGIQIKRYMLEKEKLEEIPRVEKYLKIICNEKHYNEERRFDLQDHPTYLEVKYRQAQIEQIKGIVYVLKNKQKDEWLKFFMHSNEIIVKLLEYAKEHREEKFLYPHYAKETKAINHYFLGEIEEIDNCCYKARPYIKYEQARICYLLGDYDKAKTIVSEIPPNDTCFNKGQRLLEKIKNEA